MRLRRTGMASSGVWARARPCASEQVLTHLGLPSAPVRADPAQPPPPAAANLFADTLA